MILLKEDITDFIAFRGKGKKAKKGKRRKKKREGGGRNVKKEKRKKQVSAAYNGNQPALPLGLYHCSSRIE